MPILPFDQQDLVIPRDSARWAHSDYSFRTITPMFGGGFQPRELDKITPLRGQTVRGHLRFWWRATCGRRFSSVNDLSARESKIWGVASCPGEVDIRVEVSQATPVYGANRDDFPPNHPRYALFPFQPNDNAGLADEWSAVHFKLSLRFINNPELANEVRTAVWAWANFGGIGSRTRRGCGALYSPECAPTGVPTATWIADKLAELYPNEGQVLWPSLVNEPSIANQPRGHLIAWEAAINVLAKFRQYPTFARNGTMHHPGRSHWPEADTLRAQNGPRYQPHAHSITSADPSVTPAFPRAELGLPYEVKFPNNNPDHVSNVHVYPAGSKRMASPIIARPLAVGPTGGQSVPMILILSAPAPEAVRVIRGEDQVDFANQILVRDPRLNAYPNSPLATSAQGSALEAFRNFVGEHLH
jgi:CRISPR-associated protein Cmr1